MAEAQDVVNEASSLGIGSLIEQLRNNYWLVRSMACEALGDRGDMSASSELTRLLGDENTTVRSRAREALEDLHDYRLTEAHCRELYKSVSGNELPAAEERRLFVSYSRKDTEFARRLLEDLQKEHVTVWIDSIKIANDEASEGEVIDAVAPSIRSSEFLLVIVSKHSIESAWIEREMRIARLFQRYRNPITLIAINIDSSKIPAAFANYGPFINYDFSNSSSHAKSLRALVDFLNKPGK